MKTKILLLFILHFFFLGWSQDAKYDLLKDQTSTKILYNRVFNGAQATQLKKDRFTAVRYFQLYNEMQKADFLQRLPALSFLKEQANMGFVQQEIPLSLLIVDFENISTEALRSGKFNIGKNDQLSLKGNPQKVFDEYQLQVLAPILDKTKSQKPNFILKSDLIFNTTNAKISEIKILDGKTWKEIIPNQSFDLSFPENGVHEIWYQLKLSNGTLIKQSFNLNVQYQKRGTGNKGSGFLQPLAVNSITASIPYQGYGETAPYLGQGEYEVFLDTVDGVLDRPVVLVDGFDPGDTRNTAQIYQMLNVAGSTVNLGDQLRAQGYDVIVLNFPVYTRTGTTTVVDGGVDYIQRNAMILVELLKELNTQKVGNFKNVVIGPSMGGLITRYALKYMEQNSLNHDARLYLSFDAPHLGANVPIGFQHLFNYMGYGPLGDATMQGLVDGMLKSPAAREMLIDHFEGHLKSNSAYDFDPAKLLPEGSPNYRNVFQTELNTMGFPTTTRNIAIINGAGNATANGTPGMVVLDHTFNTSSTQRAIININYTPAANQTKEVSHFKGQQWILTWINFYESSAQSKSPTYTDGLDTAPGGKFDLTAFAAGAGSSPMLQEFLDNLKTDHFCFIPALSAMSITSTQNLYSNLTGGMNTPFAAYYMPTTNQNHVTLDNQNVQFALNEILEETLTTTDLAKTEIWVENPVGNTIKLRLSSKLENAQIQITEMSGRQIYSSTHKTLAGNVELPVNLTPGNYILSIRVGQKMITRKLIKGNTK